MSDMCTQWVMWVFIGAWMVLGECCVYSVSTVGVYWCLDGVWWVLEVFGE